MQNTRHSATSVARTAPRLGAARKTLHLALLATALTATPLAAQTPHSSDLAPATLLHEVKIDQADIGTLGPGSLQTRFGQGIAFIGDLDLDGHGDIAVGAETDGPSDDGAVYIVFLDQDGEYKSHTRIGSPVPQTTSTGNRFGQAVAPMGDVDGDGVGDLAVGMRSYTPPGYGADYKSGSVVILFMNRDGTLKNHQLIAPGIGGFPTQVLGLGDYFGTSVTALDLDGDGQRELVAGAINHDTFASAAGLVVVMGIHHAGIPGVTPGTISSYKLINAYNPLTLTLDTQHQFGMAVANAGDLTGDGIPDLAVGAAGEDSSRGAVWLLEMNADGSAESAVRIAPGTDDFPGSLDQGDQFGDGLAMIPDLDGDGDPELAIGAWGDDGDGSSFNHGALYIARLDGMTVEGSYKLDAQSTPFVSSMSDDKRFGTEVASAFDVPAGPGSTTSFEVAVGGFRPAFGDDPGTVWILDLMDSRWIDHGFALPGSAGEPHLVGEGTLLAGDPVSLELTDVPTNTLAWLIRGPAAINAPFFGGTLVPQPSLLTPFPTAFGTIAFTATMPAGTPPGLHLFLQFWVQDAEAPFGYSASNAVQATTPEI